MQQIDKNALTFDAVAQDYLRSDLFPPEQTVLGLLGDKLDRFDMLDLGVGAGRTTYTFAPRVRTYLGVDYAPKMVEACRARFSETDRVRFMYLDATDMASLSDSSFDLVLFSFNGIDCVSLEQRRAILREVHRLLRPGGYFFFSSHSLDPLPWKPDWPRFNPQRPLYSTLRFISTTKALARRYWVNRHCDIAELKQRGWALLREETHNFGLVLFYGTRAYQLQEIATHGFQIESCFGLDGRTLMPPTQAAPDYSIHYLCRKAP